MYLMVILQEMLKIPFYIDNTEPSVEVDLSCFKCGGKGCNLCKGTGFIEVLGAGMVHPDVLRMGGYDPKVYTGFCFLVLVLIGLLCLNIIFLILGIYILMILECLNNLIERMRNNVIK